MTPTPAQPADQLARAARNLVAHSTEPELTGKRELVTPCADHFTGSFLPGG